MTVWDRMLSHKDIADLLDRMNTLFGHNAPLNGVVQYQLLISKTRAQDFVKKVVWNLILYKVFNRSRKLAVASWSLSCFSKEGGSPGPECYYLIYQD